MKKLILMLTVLLIALSLAACETYTEPEFTTHTIYQDDFEFFEATVDGFIGDKTEWRLRTPDGNLPVSDNVYNNAQEFLYESISYKVYQDGTLEFDYAATDPTPPDPLIEYVEAELNPDEWDYYLLIVVSRQELATDNYLYVLHEAGKPLESDNISYESSQLWSVGEFVIGIELDEQGNVYFTDLNVITATIVEQYTSQPEEEPAP